MVTEIIITKGEFWDGETSRWYGINLHMTTWAKGQVVERIIPPTHFRNPAGGEIARWIDDQGFDARGIMPGLSYHIVPQDRIEDIANFIGKYQQVEQ